MGDAVVIFVCVVSALLIYGFVSNVFNHYDAAQLKRDNARFHRLACMMADAIQNNDMTTYKHAVFHLMRHAGINVNDIDGGFLTGKNNPC